MGEPAFIPVSLIRRLIMFRKLLLIVFAMSLLMQSRLVWGDNYDFRHTRWGMTQEEVIGSEDKMDPVEKTENTIKYKAQILGKNVELLYLFAQNKLIGSSYKLDDNYLNSYHFIGTYNKFKQALIRKYGQPDKDTTNWLNDTYKSDYNKWGLALSLGHTEYAASWNTQNTTIECSLKEENYYVLCLVKYWGTEYSHLSNVFKKDDKPEEIKKVDTLDPF
jgi:hypothetical protein